MNMEEKIGLEGMYASDSMGWCAVFMNFICAITGKPLVDTQGSKYSLTSAFSFCRWGEDVPKNSAWLGDIVVSKRRGFHVALIIAESPNTFHILGGNQNHEVCFAEIKKSSVLYVRRYYATEPPASARKYYVSMFGRVLE
jgi:uncharacterized protein (TIGR02594 family)